MLDPLAQQLGVGGTFGMLFVWLLLKYKPWQNGKRGGHNSGEQSIDFWREAIRDIVQEVAQSESSSRNEQIREIVRQELEQFRKASEQWRRERFRS